MDIFNPKPEVTEEAKANAEKKLPRYKQYLKWKEASTSRLALNHLANGISADILKEANVDKKELRNIAIRIRNAYFSSFRSFYVCESCNKKLTNKKLRSDARKSNGMCAICKTKSSYKVERTSTGSNTVVLVQGVHKKVFNLTLKQAKEYVTTHFPATFI